MPKCNVYGLHLIIINCSESMKEQMIIPGSSSQKSYSLLVDQQPISFNCQMKVEHNNLESSAKIIRLDDDVSVENHYCQISENQVIKITKIRIEGEVVTLTDRIFIHREEGKEQDLCKNQGSLGAVGKGISARDKPALRQEGLSQMLGKFKSWIRDHKPLLLVLLKEIRQNSGGQEELKEKINCHSELREAFFKFRNSKSCGKGQKDMRSIVQEWHRAFLPAHKRHLKDQLYLNKLLADNLDCGE